MTENGSKASKARTVVRAVVFLVLAAVLFIYLNEAFVMKGSGQNRGAFDGFYELDHDIVDVMYLGTSATSRFFVNPIAYTDYGIASYSLAPQNSPTFYLKDLIKEAELTQDPDLYVIELRSTKRKLSNVTDAYARLTHDTMSRFSPNRLEMSEAALKYVSNKDGQKGESLFDYYFPIAKYHTRLVNGEMKPEDFLLQAERNETQGYHLSKFTVSSTVQEPAQFTDEAKEVPADMKPILDDLLDYCDTLDKEVLFVLSPMSGKQGAFEVVNGTAAYVENRGYKVLNCNDDEICAEMGIDWSTDYYNSRHMNYLGAQKYTAYLSRYLKENYDLPDRRGDDTYSAWERGLERFKEYTADGILYSDSGADGED